MRRPPAPPAAVVHGTLVAARGAAALPGGQAEGAATSAALAARRGRDPAHRRLGPLTGVLAAAALFGLGWLRERRDLHPHREAA
jgi:hypothetical protein